MSLKRFLSQNSLKAVKILLPIYSFGVIFKSGMKVDNLVAYVMKWYINFEFPGGMQEAEHDVLDEGVFTKKRKL